MNIYSENERLQKQMEFIIEADKIKNIFRQTYIADVSRRENDAEHSWHLALMCLVLGEYAPEGTDLLRAMQMTLVHDMIEIDAGDTYAYDPEANKTKRERELKAADRIFNILPEGQAQFVRALWDEFEAAKTNESKFANAMDVLHPVLMNDAGDGYAWVEHGVYEEQVRTRIARIRPGSETLWKMCSDLVDRNISEGKIIPAAQNK